MERGQIKFKEFLKDLSKDYVGVNYRWLRMLLFGVIPIQCLEVSTTGLELFNNLAESGKISKTDLTLLSEIAEVTEQTSAKERIAEYKKTIQCRKTKTRLTPYRKALYKTTVNIGSNDLLNVTNFYPLAARNFDDIWDAVFYLEKEKHLDDTKEKCKTFADLLNETARKILLDAADNLKIRDATESLPQQHLDTQFEQTHQPLTAPFPFSKRRPNAEDSLTSRDHDGTETFVLSKPIAGQKRKHILEKHTTCLWISLIVVAVLVAIVIQQSVIEPTTEPVGETTTTQTAPSKDGQKEEPREMKGNNRHERLTDPARERTISSKSISNDFSHSINYAGWKHYGKANWERHNKRIIFGYNLGERYSGSGNYYIYVAKSDQFSEGYLDSPEIPDEWDDVCLKFDYYISNEFSRIDVDHIVNGEEKKGFNSPGHFVHEQWNYARVPINTVDINNSYFRFGGKVYGSSKQIVVIDNIDISEGEC